MNLFSLGLYLFSNFFWSFTAFANKSAPLGAPPDEDFAEKAMPFM